jgi:hypothetical protein
MAVRIILKIQWIISSKSVKELSHLLVPMIRVIKLELLPLRAIITRW